VGQKIHPGGMRVGVIHDWKSNWYTNDKDFADALQEDIKIREHIIGKLSHAGLSDILIRKDKQRITVDIYTARPGIVIGKSGAEVDALRRDLHALTQKNVHININEIKRPELDAKLVAQSIAEQLQNRVAFRRAMKRALTSAMRSGAKGCKIQVGGRLGGEQLRQLHVLLGERAAAGRRGDENVAALRFNRNVNPQHAADRFRPRAGGVHQNRRRNIAFRRAHLGDVVRIQANAIEFNLANDLDALLLRPLREPHRHAIRIGHAIGRAIGGALDAGEIEPRRQRARFVQRQQGHARRQSPDAPPPPKERKEKPKLEKPKPHVKRDLPERKRSTRPTELDLLKKGAQ
jgi:ribosomal protein S3